LNRSSSLLRRLFAGNPLEMARRASTSSPGATSCIRLCAGQADGCAGLIIDRFGSLIVAVDYSTANRPPAGPGAASPLMAIVRNLFAEERVIVKSRVVAAGSAAFVCERFTPPGAEAEPIVAMEAGLKFEVGTDPAHDFGLYLDAAKARLHVRRISRGKRVLNLFSYTAAFGIAAAAGGAEEVTNVDPNRDYLAWAMRNARLNDVRLRVLPDTAQDFLGKHLRRLARSPATPGFDVVIVDPPAFGVGRGNERVLRRLWPEIFDSLRRMNPEHVVLMCNDKYFRESRSFVQLVEAELGARYHFSRLGTHLDKVVDARAALTADEPELAVRPRVEDNEDRDHHEDPYYLEPVVLAGRRR
jgi:23S rRNA G2069 N7-methylase RlmK/C1962 C5-methylase RlmI